MIILFLTSGLFLGWSLGANDAANVFGSAVGSKMISFWKAAIIASVFVILGAVFQGSGTSETLSKLGAVNALGGSFTVALAAAVTVYLMVKFSIPVSSTQSIVGAIIGWNLFTGNTTDRSVLTQIVTTWVAGPVLGAIFAVILVSILMKIKKKAGIHLIRFESYIRTSLIIAGAFGAYSLGANNIANVMGVFVPAFNLQELSFGFFTLSSPQQLFLLGGLAIAAGILSYSGKVMQVVGSSIVELSSEAALVVVLSQGIVLFLFSSSGISEFLKNNGLFPLPLVPVSSTQVVIGSIIGIGFYKGARNINFRLLGSIGAGWLITPVFSGLLACLTLYFVKNVFSVDVGSRNSTGTISGITEGSANISDASASGILGYFIIGVLIVGVISLLLYYILERKKKIEFQRSEEKFWKYLK
ncbi:MAG: inorganic phosphate transporter [Bacteroidales bacterium]|nr:inorganic phosphate transporter [Bacteroidales bacterium]HPM18429.1 inorganic phosphate transporter [Bacteroidales bacterium]HQG77359.1 inorganic phosphate transporter [Bacteroidales bacterium]